MKQTKIKIAIFALALVFMFSVAAFFGVNFKPADASGTVTVSGTNVFTASGEANVIADKQEQGEGDNKKEVYYTMFTFGKNEDNVSFRRNLAYDWFYQEQPESTEGDENKLPDGPVKNGHFNMEIGFKNTGFKKFVITFESQQYSKTEDGKTVNYIMFFPADGGVNVLVTQDKDANAAELNAATLNADHISIKFIQKLENGEYAVEIGDGTKSVTDYKMENVGGTYAKYSSSSTTPVYPLIFNAEFEEEKTEDDGVAQMVLYSLNNQEFQVGGKGTSTNPRFENGIYVGGSVLDDTPAVLCLNKEISHLTIGGQVKFDYQVIDVLRSSPSSTLYYYVLTSEDVKDETVNYNNYNDKERFKEVESDTQLDSDREFYLPATPVGFGGDEDFKIDMAVKVYAKVVDITSNSEESYVFLDWYLKDGHKLSVNGYDFIAVGDDESGVTYNKNSSDKTWKQIYDDYQGKVNEAAKNLSAGSSSYLYLPSAEELFFDNATAYKDMKISIYYYGESQSQNTSLSPNNLSINVTKQGDYIFTLYATDVAGNDMYYFDEDGKAVKFKSSEIWDIYKDEEKQNYLPWFKFSVDYKGVQFKEKPDKQTTAYVGTNYSSASFEINGVENSYETKYRLFLFDRAGYYKDTNETFTYEEFIAKMDGLFEGKDTRKYFTEIPEVKESDEDYDEFKDYKWSSTSTSFTPQDGNAFYYIRAEVTDTEYNTAPVTCSLAVVASKEAKALEGDSEWLQNNLPAVILLSIAGVSLIAIILLLVIKPKSKEDIDVQFEKEKTKKNKNK